MFKGGKSVEPNLILAEHPGSHRDEQPFRAEHQGVELELQHRLFSALHDLPNYHQVFQRPLVISVFFFRTFNLPFPFSLFRYAQRENYRLGAEGEIVCGESLTITADNTALPSFLPASSAFSCHPLVMLNPTGPPLQFPAHPSANIGTTSSPSCSVI